MTGKRTRKFVTIALTVSVPLDMSHAQARLEVRTLINEQSNHTADYGEVKAFAVRAGKKG